MEYVTFQQMFKTNSAALFAHHGKNVFKHKEKGRHYEIHRQYCTSPSQQENREVIEILEGNYNPLMYQRQCSLLTLLGPSQKT